MNVEPAHDPLIGTVAAGRYKVLRQLGEGGMGQVYLAEHIAIEKKVALKVLRPEFSSKGEIVTRFQQEAISASRIKHPNVLDVFDFGRLESGSFYLAMEFLEGNDLADELVRQQILPVGRAIRIALQICRALAAAHARGVVHRDLKPENVFLQRTGDGEEIVKIVDFGIAQLRSPEEATAGETKRRRLTRTGMIFGTPEYMAPEQAGGKHADLRSDIYAVGVILYEMLTGAVPFTGDSFLDILGKHLHERAPTMVEVCPGLTVSAELQAAVMKALAKTPPERHASMSDFASAILATPDAAQAPHARMSAIPDVAITDFNATAPLSPGHPTAAQFGTQAPRRAASQPARAAQSPGAPPQAGPASKDGYATTTEGLTAAPAHTQLEAETTPAGGRRSSSGVIVGMLVVGIAALAAGAFVFLGAGDAGSQAKPESTLSTQAAEPPAKPEPVVAPVATPKAAEPAPPNKIKLTVETEPAGAVLSKNGFQICDETPCEVLADLNDGMELEAKKGNLTGKAKVLAQSDQTVTIRLVAPAAPKPKPKPATLCEVEVDGLKILRPCK